MTSQGAPQVDLTFDPFDPAFKEDPYPYYRRLREEAPTFYSEKHDLRVLTRFDDVRTVARDWRTYTSSVVLDLDRSSEVGFKQMDFISFDPPRHDVFRNMLKHPFQPKAIAAMKPRIAERARLLLDGIERGVAVDMGERFAHPLPLYVVGTILGVPEPDFAYLSPRLTTWIDRPAPDAMIEETSIKAGAEMAEYLASVAGERRQSPGDDLLTVVSRTEVDGRLLTDEELGAACLFLFVAGVDTTTSLILNLLYWYAQFPEQRRLVAEDRSLVPAAVEECLRFDAPIQHVVRVTTADAEIRGLHLPSGSRVMLTYGAANRDEDRFEHGEMFDVLRPRKRHLAFGEGIHHCLGADLARAEAQIALDLLLDRMPDWQVTGPNTRLRKENQRGFRMLTVVP